MPAESGRGTDVTQGSLQGRVASFSNWHYQFDLGGGVVTPIFDTKHVNRHSQREGLIIGPS